MVLESLISPTKAERHPWELFFIGFIYSSVAVFISLQIFSKYTGLVSVFLTVLACVPLIYMTMKMEEKKDTEGNSEMSLLREHSRAISFFMFLFFGIVLSFSLWYLLIPSDSVYNLFSVQIETINSINRSVVGNFDNPSLIFTKILFNNVKVLIFCILFSFFYGMGAIFILTWNASVVAVAMGNFIRTKLSSAASATGLSVISSHLQILPIAIARYLVHGSAEIIAYFIGGLAGGIISVAVINHDFRSEIFGKIVLDASSLILIAIGFLFVGALLEVYITPLFF